MWEKRAFQLLFNLIDHLCSKILFSKLCLGSADKYLSKSLHGIKYMPL